APDGRKIGRFPTHRHVKNGVECVKELDELINVRDIQTKNHVTMEMTLSDWLKKELYPSISRAGFNITLLNEIEEQHYDQVNMLLKSKFTQFVDIKSSVMAVDEDEIMRDVYTFLGHQDSSPSTETTESLATGRVDK